ncbi:elongation of very long chain fatty acids protein F-like [Drosophila albomicans]|uniref:Elongation of very long chain fatty acids protein n=1 Tax=Drosophila albomicans TaxID=7291 RepID=A0A6P8XIZ4_DROAB|nr:elongation of very long chain fatty acids protein F-like [Drosophila albomicans]
MFELFPIADPVPWPFASVFWPLGITITAYLIFVLKLGPMLMANREPFNLRGVLKVYNLFQIIYNIILVLCGLYLLLWSKAYPDLSCIMILPLDHEMKNIDRIINYLYLLNKIVDLLDTIFFVLRKSYKQITLLHLIHHVYMPSGCYFFLRLYGFGGHLVLTGTFNSITHTVMYIYYYLSSQNPNIKQSIWWKQYVTIMQMVQFILMFIHSLWTLMQKECEMPYPLIFIVFFIAGLMLVMFTNFYIKSYLKKNTTTTNRRM